jgi:hypothetical protein
MHSVTYVRGDEFSISPSKSMATTEEVRFTYQFGVVKDSNESEQPELILNAIRDNGRHGITLPHPQSDQVTQVQDVMQLINATHVFASTHQSTFATDLP